MSAFGTKQTFDSSYLARFGGFFVAGHQAGFIDLAISYV